MHRGEHVLPTLVEELARLTSGGGSPEGTPFRVCEAVLVHVGGPDRSDTTIRRLVEAYDFVRPRVAWEIELVESTERVAADA